MKQIKLETKREEKKREEKRREKKKEDRHQTNLQERNTKFYFSSLLNNRKNNNMN